MFGQQKRGAAALGGKRFTGAYLSRRLEQRQRALQVGGALSAKAYGIRLAKVVLRLGPLVGIDLAHAHLKGRFIGGNRALQILGALAQMRAR